MADSHILVWNLRSGQPFVDHSESSMQFFWVLISHFWCYNCTEEPRPISAALSSVSSLFFTADLYQPQGGTNALS